MTAAASPSPLADLLSRQRAAFQRSPYPSVRDRKEHLRMLERVLENGQEEIATALNKDFGGRSRYEVLFSEIFVSLHAARHARKHVKEWTEDRRRPLDWPLQPARAWVMPQPLGVVGIIAAWNYPIFVSMAPLAGALAAGNRVMIKLSEFTPVTSETMARLLAAAFSQDQVAVVEGDAEAGRAFSSLPFDHLLFTGSTVVGREVMRAAAANLTPVTLELGGKSPAIIAEDANLDSAAADTAYGKFLNAGQTCIAPDYVLVPRGRLEAFIQTLSARIAEYWPEPSRNPDYTAVINDRHASRIEAYIEEAIGRDVRVIRIGPPREAGSRRIAPALIIDPPDDLAAMGDEIFGPVLPVVPYSTLEDAIRYVNERPRPLALYVFAKSGRVIDQVLERTVSGGVCVNDTLMHIAAEDLPFGGVGPSGYGHYHGRDGFDTFSKLKPVFRRRWPGLGRSLRPPYGRMHKLLKRLLIG